MNFFQAQDTARRKTWQLGLLFGAAVVTLVVLTNLLVAAAFGWFGSQQGLSVAESITQVPADSWLWVTAGVIGIVATASLYKFATLSGGGKTIAEALGGQLIRQSTTDPQQRQLLNVVEEMAIASGLAVPPVYLIPEASINAFAAGFTPDDAVIGINQGTLDLLDRAELQGVVAHEFSHILNGDTNINLRLIAILHGILFIGMIGYGLLRAGAYSRRNGMPLLAVGAGLMAVGYGGTLFGNVIKAAVSRQREFLADASAVQFTRDPSGIADALKKIGGFSYGSTIASPKAEQASHMFFGAAAPKFAQSLMATHPPLEARISAIEPTWNGVFPTVTTASAATTSGSLPGTAGFAGSATQAITNPEDVVAMVGTPDQSSLQQARVLIADNDEALTTAAHDPFEARALIYAMLLDDRVISTQLAHIDANAEHGVPLHVHRLQHLLKNTDAAHKLTLLEMAIPALKELSSNQYERFTSNTAELITADGHVDVFEWVLHRLLVKELYPHFQGPQNVHGRIGNIRRLSGEAGKLLSILASHSQSNVQGQIDAYQAGAAELGIEEPFSQQTQFDYQRMNQTLGKLRKLKPLVKPALIKACARTVLHDGRLDSTEAALLQGVAATLDCPLPPSIYAKKAA